MECHLIDKLLEFQWHLLIKKYGYKQEDLSYGVKKITK